MNVESGWGLYSSDFSRVVTETSSIGSVTLKRKLAETVRWLALPETEQDRIPLYVVGQGATFDEALINANLAAAHAPAIPTV